MNYITRRLQKIMSKNLKKRQSEPKREDIPYYSDLEKCWKVKIDGNETKGDVYVCVSEFVSDNLFYRFSDGDHGHSFDAVLTKILQNSDCDDIEGDKTQYSAQEIKLIDLLKEKLKSLKK